MQLAQTERVEIFAAALEIGIVLLPRLHSVAVGARGVQYCLPKLFDGLGLVKRGEHLLCPRLARHRRNDPLIFVLHRVADRLYDLPAHLDALAPLFLIQPVKTRGVGRLYIDHGRKRFGSVQKLLLFPIFYLAEALDGLVFYMLEPERLMRPLDPYLGSACKIALLNEHFHKFRLIKLGRNDNILSLLDIRADPDYKLGVAFKFFYIHE